MISLFEHTLVINLEEREDRRLTVFAQLKKIGIQHPERIAAIKTKYGAVGCSMSHIKCIEHAKKNNWEYVCVIEDDFKCVNPEKFQSSISKFQENSIKDGIQWDVLLIGGNNCPPYYTPPNVNYCVQITQCACTIGYVVKRDFYDILIENYREGASKLMRDPTNKREFAIDMYWKHLQRSGRWYLLFPLTITQETCYSDVEERVTNYDHLMLDIDKPWLFASSQQTRNVLQKMVCIKGSGSL